MRKALGYLILLAVLSCTATFISVRKSDNTTINTETKTDSLDLGDWDWSDDDQIGGNKNDTIKKK